MSKQGEWLVGRNGIEGLLIGAGADKRVAANSLAVKCGYDPAHPHPFYPVTVAVCLAQRLGKLLYAELSEAEAQIRLGRDCAQGYAATIAGMTALSHSRPLKVGDALRYGVEVTKREIPSLKYQVEEISERHYRIEMIGWRHHPNFLVGAFLFNLEVNGAKQFTCEVEVKDELHYVYELTWA